MSKQDWNDLSIVEVPGERRSSNEHEKVFKGTTVPNKYRGTAADQHDMAVLGKKQVLRRNFKFLTILGFASTVGHIRQEQRLLDAQTDDTRIARYS